LEFAETDTSWVFSMSAYDRLADQLREGDLDKWAERKVRIKLYVDRDSIFDGKRCAMFKADGIDREEALEPEEARDRGPPSGAEPPPPTGEDDYGF
jgi:hypothetical protein